MRHSAATIPVLSLFIGVLLLSQCSLFARVPTREGAPGSWERLFFRSIDAATEKAGLVPLRDKPLRSNELEVRVWRGFGLSDLEGVVLNRSNGVSTGAHILGDHYIDITSAETEVLPDPKDGWERFWGEITTLRIFRISEPPTGPCREGMIDGVGHVIEISGGGVYRTYLYQSGLSDCADSMAVHKIGEFIGEQFYDGRGECKTAEWFPCSELLRMGRENNTDSR